jgi:hypothetical protein
MLKKAIGFLRDAGMIIALTLKQACLRLAGRPT